VHRDAVAGHSHVLAEELRAASQAHALAVDQQLGLPQLRAQLGVVVERHRRAVDVELGVAAGVAAVLDRQRDQLLAGVVDALGERGDHRAALGEGHGAQGRAALLAGEGERRGEVEAGRAALGHRLQRGGFTRVEKGAVPWTQDPER